MKDKIIQILEASRRDVQFINGTLQTVWNMDKASDQIMQLMCDRETEIMYQAFPFRSKFTLDDIASSIVTIQRANGYSDVQIDNALKKVGI